MPSPYRSASRFVMPNVRSPPRLGLNDAELDKLSAAILKALKGGPLDPDEIRKAAVAPLNLASLDSTSSSPNTSNSFIPSKSQNRHTIPSSAAWTR
jgi:hypothetical protein